MSQTRADNDYRTDRAPEKNPGENVRRGTQRWTVKGGRLQISKWHFLKERVLPRGILHFLVQEEAPGGDFPTSNLGQSNLRLWTYNSL